MAKKTGLVLTGGGLRGICAHAGALQALSEEGCRFDAVIGTSAGAIVGSLYAAGVPAPEIVRRISAIRREDYLDPIGFFQLLRDAARRFRGVTGYYRGEALLAWLRRNLAPKTRIEECDPPFHVTVTNVSRGLPQVKTAGPLAEFARASAAIPMAFQLQEVEGELYADGGAVNNVPVDELVELRPELEQLLIVTALDPTPGEPPVDNSFLDKPWTPFRALARVLEAIAAEQKIENLEAGGRPVQTFRIEAPDLDLDEPEKTAECIRRALEDARRRIADGTVDLSEVRKLEAEPPLPS